MVNWKIEPELWRKRSELFGDGENWYRFNRFRARLIRAQCSDDAFREYLHWLSPPPCRWRPFIAGPISGSNTLHTATAAHERRATRASIWRTGTTVMFDHWRYLSGTVRWTRRIRIRKSYGRRRRVFFSAKLNDSNGAHGRDARDDKYLRRETPRVYVLYVNR